MNIVQAFENYSIRFVEHPEKKYEFGIVAADLAFVLDLDPKQTNKMPVDDEWKGQTTITTPGGTQSMSVIWEPGIYQLLAKSRKPQAKPFQKWLFEQVLPSIRKTGNYSVADVSAALSPRDTIDYIDAAEKLDLMQDSTLKMLLKDCLVDELELKRNQKTLPGGAEKKKYTIVKVRAKQLGYTPKEIGDGSKLGRFVHARIKPAYQEMVGRWPVFHYEIDDELDTTIHTFFGAKKTQLLN